MAHTEQGNFCKSLKLKFKDYFINKRVLEIGSYNVNGTIRDLFENCDYIGVDIAPGNCVDVVSKAHEYKSDELFDVVCSCEMLEHDMYLDLSLKNMVNLLKPNGLFFFTCATENRAEHGTINRNQGDSPLTTQIDVWKTYYKNVSEQDIRNILDLESIFVSYRFEFAKHEDMYFWGIKNSVNNLNYDLF